MQVAHLQTGHTGGPTAVGGSTSKAGGHLAQRSVLGALLPESLLYVLTTGGAGAFAAALVADSDTPELVWTHRMRAQVLVPQVRPSAFLPRVLSWTSSGLKLHQETMWPAFLMMCRQCCRHTCLPPVDMHTGMHPMASMCKH